MLSSAKSLSGYLNFICHFGCECCVKLLSDDIEKEKKSVRLQVHFADDAN
jgi:hypothetical protein